MTALLNWPDLPIILAVIIAAVVMDPESRRKRVVRQYQTPNTQRLGPKVRRRLADRGA